MGNAWTDQSTAIDTAHAPAECSNRGICDRSTGRCTCDTNFVGAACERLKCPNDCSGHGECRSAAYHFEQRGHTYPYWDAEQVYGCACDSGYVGYDCSRRACATGDDPMTTGQANEVQLFQCSAASTSSSTFTLTYYEYTTGPIAPGASATDLKAALEALPNIPTGGISVSLSAGNTLCDAAAPVTSVTFTQNFGPQRELIATHAFGVAFSGPTRTASLGGVSPVPGTKEGAECSNRGRCNEITGICECYTNFATSNGYNVAGDRGDCGFATAVIAACPGEVECSGHGVCAGTPTFACTCEVGWEGGDCSERTCPSGLAWFWTPDFVTGTPPPTPTRPEIECSGAGLCDRATGTCACRSGFEGGACERLECPVVSTLACNDKGQCLSMAQLAEVSVVDGQATSLTYGATPNDQLRWDADKLRGCFCNPGYTGYDCTLRECPSGDDPRTPAVAEVQALRCVGDGRTFSLELGQVQGVPVRSAPIAATATAAEVQTALAAMSTIDAGVSVSLRNGSSGGNATAACSADGTTVIRVELPGQGGQVPLFRTLPELVASLTCSVSGCTPAVTAFGRGQSAGVVATVQTTAEDEECSQRGLCASATGLCQCFTGYGSSDGSGQRGTVGDCGYLEPIVPLDDASASSASLLATTSTV